MYRVTLSDLGFKDQWRTAARRLASHGVPPDQVVFGRNDDMSSGDLFSATSLPEADGDTALTVPATFLKLADTVLCERDQDAPGLLYQALVRHQSNRRALSNPADPISRRLEKMAKSVRRDIHKMHAFVRFREISDQGPRRRFGAWFEPETYILESASPFFAKRFGDMDWMISTPQGIARFDDGKLSYHPPGPRPDLPDDASEALWGTYFANIFNPARIKLSAMRSEMPLKYWKNMPETRLIPEMLEGAEARVAAMREAMPTQAPAWAARVLERQKPEPQAAIPQSLADAQRQAMGCTRCNLCEAATQTVWGTGDIDAPLMIVGEQPGDAEDLAGKPFVGPAGQLLRQTMEQAGVGPAWMTNAVKHFKFVSRGKRRIHQNPNRTEISHCRWWLDQERSFVQPKLTVALGASAALSLTGNANPMGPRRGHIEHALDGGPVLISWHPSYILRLPPEPAARAQAELTNDLKQAASFIAKL